MRDALDDRIIAALRAEAESGPTTLTEAAIHERMTTRPMRSGWAGAVLPVLGVLVLVAVALAIAAPRTETGTADRLPTHLRLGDPRPVADATFPPLLIEEAEDCPVTQPTTAPPEIGDRLFGSGSAHGNADLWVGGLWPHGITAVGESYVASDGSIGMKFGWWRNLRGQLEITGRRLDGDAPALEADVPDGYGDTGFQASGVSFPTEGCWEVTGTVGGSSLTFVTFVSRSAPDLPVGTFQAAQPFDATCLAITVSDPRDRRLAARWWNPGASGNCSTRTSDIVDSTAEYIGPVLLVEMELMDGDTRVLSLRLTGVGSEEIRFARSGESEVRFVRVEEVAPTFAPAP